MMIIYKNEKNFIVNLVKEHNAMPKKFGLLNAFILLNATNDLLHIKFFPG